MPLPRSHNHEVGEPMLESLKDIMRGAQPETAFAEKSALSCELAFWVQKANKSINPIKMFLRRVITFTSFVDLYFSKVRQNQPFATKTGLCPGYCEFTPSDEKKLIDY